MTSFLIIWIGQIFSSLGSGLTTFALGVWVYDQTGSVSLLSLNMLAGLIPYLIVSPLGGVLADRINRRMLLIVGDLGAGLSSLMVLALLATDNLQIWHVYVATAVNSGFSAIQTPAYSAAIPQLVPKHQLGRANGLVQAQYFLYYLIAPAIAGLLYVSDQIGLIGIILIDLATFVIAIITQFIVRIPNPVESSAKIDLWKDFREGWVFITTTAGLLQLALFYMVINFFQEFTYPLIQPLLLEITTPAGFGISQSIMGAGAIVGTIIMAVWGGPRRPVATLLALYAFNGLIIMLAGGRPNIIFITICGFIYFAANPIVQSLDSTFMQTKVPIHTQGRVFAAFNMLTSAVKPFALILVGPLADNVFEPALAPGGALAGSIGQIIGVGPGRGVALFIAVLGIAMAVTSLIAFFARPIRRLDDLPDVV